MGTGEGRMRRITVNSSRRGVEILEEDDDASSRVDLTWTEVRRLLLSLRRAIKLMAPPVGDE